VFGGVERSEGEMRLKGKRNEFFVGCNKLF
jgi:hypothetical protein